MLNHMQFVDFVKHLIGGFSIIVELNDENIILKKIIA